MPVLPSRDIDALIRSARKLASAVSLLKFGEPVACVYNPLSYAWGAHELYLRTYGAAPKRVVFLGMNPGPFGMVQTGVPFGEVTAVRGWLKLECRVGRPARQHPRRPVFGFECPRCEISGQRLWGFFADTFGTAPEFFQEHFVLNYCPLAFVEASGRNRTPDKLPPKEREALFVACDEHLRTSIAALNPEWLIAIGDFAFKRASSVFMRNAENLSESSADWQSAVSPIVDRPARTSPRLGRILHPSPASPAANRGWAQLARAQLERLGVWKAIGKSR